MFVMVLVVQPIDLFAAGPVPPLGPPPPPGGAPPCWPGPCIPIDGGIGILIAAGLAYGGNKLMKSSGKKQSGKL